MATPRAKTVSLDEIAAVFNVTPEAIRLWRKEGMPTRQVSGRPAFVVAECVQWRRRQDREDRRQTDDTAAADKRRLLRAQADREELELAQLAGELVQRVDSEREVEAFIGGFVAAVSGRLTQFERAMVQVKNPADARELTERIQSELFGAARDYASAVESAEDDDEEGE